MASPSRSIAVPEIEDAPQVLPVESGLEGVLASLTKDVIGFRCLVAQSRGELQRLEARVEEGNELLRIARNRELRVRASMSTSISVD